MRYTQIAHILSLTSTALKCAAHNSTQVVHPIAASADYGFRAPLKTYHDRDEYNFDF